MKTILFAITLSLASISAAAANGYGHGSPGGHSQGYHGGRNQNGVGIIVGVPGPFLPSPGYINPAVPPPVAYGIPYPGYPVGTTQPQPGICVERRTVYGDEGQIGRENGRRFWTSRPYSVTERVQVPCQ